MPRKIDFSFKLFSLAHDQCEMKVGTDAVLLGAWTSLNRTDSVLDIGCGCGIIAMMIAQRCSSCLIDAIEINASAAQQARDNISDSIFSERINVVNRPLQDFIPEKKYSLIISNPPFFENSLLSPAHERSRVRHAIDLTMADIFIFSSHYLCWDGQISVVLPHNALPKVIKSAEAFSFFPQQICHVRSHPDKLPNRALMIFAREKDSLNESELVLFESARIPTQEYKDLTKEFYLHF